MVYGISYLLFRIFSEIKINWLGTKFKVKFVFIIIN